ncbi:hypothetical protein CRI77_00390 [Mycolicibacterium duvalii]|uniref:HNH endonuclease signature motif containing protein n=1 Tax=Mycolicibacterium duvalii TaxID=39688 RepID=UPI000BEEF912|nr:HNH endonuclease signature motif containing protein [Mycolicibacterium duvalii]PEG44360.1 hypothetical protein CRI77_00390 [Mycolicibacterium duvalii]
MFDMPGVDVVGSLDAAGLIDAAGDFARAENMAAARKLAVLAELFDRRTGLASAAERSSWWLDPDAAVAAELAAAMGVSQSLALVQTHRAVALRDRLPKVAALFAQGLISDLLVRTIVYRTELITDPSAMAAVDEAVARQVGFWGALSRTKTEQAIDATVITHDPGALRAAKDHTPGRAVEFGSPSDPVGLVSMWARMHPGDAAALHERINTIAHTVCEADPRTLEQRRNDALAAIGYGLDALTCSCGLPDCAAAGHPRPAPNTTIYVLTDTTTAEPAAEAEAEAKADADADGDEAGQAEPDVVPEPAPAPAPAPAPTAKPAFLFGKGVLAPAALQPLLDNARIREIVHPGDSPAEPRYLPSRALAEFIRCRDLTCRFPHCDIAATRADIDHTVPYPCGPTHASNLKCLCRFHHLLKTFWTGPDGWYDRQHPDGTVEWTSPTGHTYLTKPGSALLFPTLCTPTGTLWSNGPPPTPTPDQRRGTMMPRRRLTRAQAHTRYLTVLRRLNGEGLTKPNGPPPF